MNNYIHGLKALLSHVYWTYFRTALDYARHIGVTVGEYTWINTRKWSSEPFLIKIGDHCQITQDVTFQTHGGGNCIRWKCPDFDTFGKIVVEDWAYIGCNAIILAGVTIGEGALVAAGSVVTKSVAPHTVVGGNPARFICTTEEYLNKNIKYNLHTKGMGRTEKMKLLHSLEEERFIKK